MGKQRRLGAPLLRAAGEQLERRASGWFQAAKTTVSSRLVLRAGAICCPCKGQFPQPLAKLLFASHGATQPQLRGRGGTLRTKAMCWSVERAGLGLADRSGKFSGWVAV